jgi:hypothetical protein
MGWRVRGVGRRWRTAKTAQGRRCGRRWSRRWAPRRAVSPVVARGTLRVTCFGNRRGLSGWRGCWGVHRFRRDVRQPVQQPIQFLRRSRRSRMFAKPAYPQNETPTDTGEPVALFSGSSGRRFKSCQPDQLHRSSKPYRRPGSPSVSHGVRSIALPLATAGRRVTASR